MVAIVSGNSLGLELTSLGVLGNQGLWGTPGQGNSGEQVYVNAATGNLVVQRRDDFLASRGLENQAIRTYNSLGLLSDDNADNWSLGVYAQQMVLTGTVNMAGSTLTRTARDGSQAIYNWDTGRSCYVAKAGGGAHDTIAYDSTNAQYVRTDGSSGEVEKYSTTTGRLQSVADADGNTNWYTYTNGLLTKVVDKSGETVWYDYTGTQLTKIRVEFKNGTDANGNPVWVTRSTVGYSYDTSGRLQTVTVDLTPEDGSTSDGKVYTTTYTYDGTSKRIKTLTQLDGTSLTFNYVLVGSDYRIQSVKDALNQEITYSYDTVNRRTTVTVDPTGMNRSWLFDYDLSGQLTKMTSPTVGGASITQNYAYDADGNVTSIVNGDGETTSMVYDSSGNQTKVSDALGNTVTRTYSSTNQLLTETVSSLTTPGLTSAAGVTVTGGDILKTGGTDAVWDSSAYSKQGYVGQASVSFEAPQANKTFMIGLNTDPTTNNSWSSLDYAFYLRANGQIEVREGGGSDNKLGTTPVYTYAANDRFRISYDGTYVRYYQNDVELLKTAATITQALYFDSSFCSSGAKVSNLRFGDRAQPDLTTRYIYSAAQPDQLRYSITPEGRVTQFQYNGFGERIAQITYTRSTFDTKTWVVNGIPTCPTEAQMGAWVTAIGDLSTSVRKEFAYDARGLLAYDKAYQSTNADGSGNTLRQTQYIYDQAGRLLQVIQPGGSSGDEAGAPTTNYAYDGLGRLLTVTDAHGALTTTAYADSTQTVTVTYQSGAIATSVYDKAGRLVKVSRSGSGATAYSYDKAGHLLMTSELNAAGVATGVRTFMLYDEAGRQVASVDADNTLTETVYDGAGRVVQTRRYTTAVNLSLLFDTATGQPKNPALSTIRPAALAADLQRWNVYDDSGRLVYEVADDGAVTQHDYDGAGRLIRNARYSVAITTTASLTLAYVAAQLATAAVVAGAANDRIERLFYSADGQLLGTLDGEGYLTRHAYDQAGRRVQTTRYANAVTGDALRSNGTLDALTPATNAKDQTEIFFYDGRGLLAGQVDAEGYITRNVYNARGLLRTQTRYATALTTAPAWTSDLDALVTGIRSGGVDALTADDRRSYWYYTLDGQLLKATNFEGTNSAYEYDASGRLIKVTQGDGLSDARVHRVRYDVWGRKVAELSGVSSDKIIDGMTQAQIDAIWNSDAVDYAYDAAGRLINTTDANGLKTRYYYDVDGRLAYTVNAWGSVVKSEFDVLGRLTTTTRYATAITQTLLSGLSGGLVDSALTSAIVVDAANDSKTGYLYNDAGQLKSTTAADGAETSYTYNAFGEVKDSLNPWQGGADINASKRQDSYSYDRRGLLLQTLRDVGGIAASTKTDYDAFGRAVNLTDANTKSRALAYDRLGRLVQTTNPLTKSVNSTYDAFGQVLTVTDELQKTTTYTYNRASRSVMVTTPEGVTVTTTRTRYGETYTVKDGNDVITTYTYDKDGRLTDAKSAGVTLEHREYDLGGRLKLTTNGNQVNTTYVYDDVKRTLTRTVEPTDSTDDDAEVNLKTTWEYDAKGQTVKVTDPRGTVTSYTFDKSGRTLTQTVDPTGLALTTQWSYDADGRVLTVTDANQMALPTPQVSTKYVYDKLGRRLSEVVDPGTGHLNLTRSYTYDKNGNVLTATDARLHVTRFTYYDDGKLRYTIDAEGGLTLNEYNDKGLLQQRTRYLNKWVSAADPTPQSVTTDPADQATRYAYDMDGRLEFTVDAAGALTKNGYDGNGNIISVRQYAKLWTSSSLPTDATAKANESTLDHLTRIEYDAFNRETFRADPMGSVTRRVYDANGNLTLRKSYYNPITASQAPSEAENNTSTSDRIERFVYDGANRLTFSSDALGAVTGRVYNGNGEITKITLFAVPVPGASPDTVVASPDGKDRITTFTYDRANRRTYAVDGMGFVDRNEYDNNGNVIRATRYAVKVADRANPGSVDQDDPNNRVQTFQYDKANRLYRSYDASETNYEEFTYYDTGEKKTFRNKNGAVWTYTYDNVGRLLTEVSPALALYGVATNNDGTLSVTGGTGSETVTTTLLYDAFGNLQKRTEATSRDEQRVTSYEYDKVGRQIKVTFPNVNIYAAETGTQLATNGATGNATRSETLNAASTIQTWYDAFGNAVASKDRRGWLNYKSYDAAGRVAYEIDALGYVTGYGRDTFGEATTVTRYANVTTFNTTTGDKAATDLTADKVSLVVDNVSLDHSLDRVLTNGYDKAGRLIKVWQPSAYVYNSGTAKAVTYGARTNSTYNAFGEVVQVDRLADCDVTNNVVTLTFQSSFVYYDNLGRKTAAVDEGGFLTTFTDYDCGGNCRTQTEYAKVTSGATVDTPPTPTSDPVNDRITKWTFDELNRKLTETKVGVKYLSGYTATSTTIGTADVTTSYGYDAVGNQIKVTDGLGNVTHTYYDALGRISAIVAPTRTSTVSGNPLIPVVEFQRDAYGNLLARIERAKSAFSVTDTAYKSAPDTVNDRTTITLFDVSGNARQVQDAEGKQHYSSFTVDGKVAKTWQTVTAVDQTTTTLYTAYVYDKLGRLVKSYSPAPQGGASVSTDYRYNGFGELTARGRDGAWYEFFDYDDAGRLWRSNAGTGHDHIYLHDLLGRRTADISSQGSGGRSNAIDVDTAIADGTDPTEAQRTANGWLTARRVNTTYDKLGYVTGEVEAERMVREGGLTTRQSVMTSAIASSATAGFEGGENSGYTTDHGTNSVSLTWPTLFNLGSGEVKVNLTYKTLAVTGQTPGSVVTRTLIFRGDQVNTGVSSSLFSWKDSDNEVRLGLIGIQSVVSYEVLKKNVNGDYVRVNDRGLSGRPALGATTTQLEIGSPIDPTTKVIFRYRLSTETGWRPDVIEATAPDQTNRLWKMGDAHFFDASGLSGTYVYEVYFTTKDGDQTKTDSGTFVAKSDDSDDGINQSWQKPTIAYTRDRWGNALTESDPRSEDWITYRTYNRDNKLLSEIRPGTLSVNQDTGQLIDTHPQHAFAYDKLGRLVATTEWQGPNDLAKYVNVQLWDEAGSLKEEVHADGGHVTYRYDAFGQKVQTVDAVGNVSGATSDVVSEHTTAFTYDRMGNLRRTDHGAGNIFRTYTVDAQLTALGAVQYTKLSEVFDYDEAGRKRSESKGVTATDSVGLVTKYWYDRAGHVRQTQLPFGTESTSTIDYVTKTDGTTVRTEKDAEGNIATWTTDYFGRLISHKNLGGDTITYVYDNAGQLSTQTGLRGTTQTQNLKYFYDAIGQLVQISDYAIGETTTYKWDFGGHHLREKIVRNGEVFQDNHLSYDMAGRLVDSADNRVHITYAYDRAGNRTHVTTHTLVDAVGNDDVETLKDSDRYFFYDAMNRQTKVDVDAFGNIGTTQGHWLEYDKNGNRIKDTFWGNKVDTHQYGRYNRDTGLYEYTGTLIYTVTTGQVTENYLYDGLNRLNSIDRDGTQVDARYYDKAGRLLQSGAINVPVGYGEKLNQGVPPADQVGMYVQRQSYDANGRMLLQKGFNSDGANLSNRFKVDYNDEHVVVRDGETNEITDDYWVRAYDKVGNVKRYRYYNYEGTDYNTDTTVTLDKFEGYVEKSTDVVTTLRAAHSGNTSTYDVNGFLTRVDDVNGTTYDKDMVNDASGRVLRVRQSNNNLWTHIVNGEIVGKHGVGPNEVDPRSDNNTQNFTQKADFGFGYRHISGSYPSPGVGQYTVRSGDDLQAIAQAAYGDSAQWWRIAQANGLSGDSDLRVGQSITLPNVVGGATNNSGTFKPYNPTDVIGDTSANLPMPKGEGGCGAAQIVMVVILVVVTLITHGATSEALGEYAADAAFDTALETEATTVAVDEATLAAIDVGSWAVGGAVGSVASQMAGMMMGVQDDIDWKQVGMSALGSAVGAGFAPGAGAQWGEVAARAGIANFVTQTVSIAAGWQDDFSWRSTVASAVGAMVGNSVRENVGEALANKMSSRALEKAVTGTAAGLATVAAQTMTRGGKFDLKKVGLDAFGVVMNSWVSYEAQSGGEQQRAEMLKAMTMEDEIWAGAAAQAQSADTPHFRNTSNAGEIPADGTSRQGLEPDPTEIGLGARELDSHTLVSGSGPRQNAHGPSLVLPQSVQTTVAGSYGGDWLSVVDGGFDDAGAQHIEVTYHRGGMSRMDNFLSDAAEHLESEFQRREDQRILDSHGNRFELARMAVNYGFERAIVSAAKGIVQLPRVYSSSDTGWALTHPREVVSQGWAEFKKLPLQDQVISVATLVGPAALKFGPGMVDKLNSLPILGSNFSLSTRGGEVTAFATGTRASAASGLSTFGNTARGLSVDGEMALGAAQQPRLVYQPNAGGVARTPEYMIDLAQKMGVYIPEGVDIQFVDPALLANKVGAQAEYGQLGKYLGDDPSKVMTWDGMAHDLTGKIPVRISNELLTSDESAVAHIAHESFELGNFEAEGQWTQRFYIQQTAAPAQGGLQASWHSQAWDYADQVILKMRGR